MARYPDELAWQLDLDRMLIRQNDKLKRLHRFLVQETESVCAWLNVCVKSFISINYVFSISLFSEFRQNIYSFCALFIMVALWNRADHYIFMRWFVLLLLSFFFFIA